MQVLVTSLVTFASVILSAVCLPTTTDQAKTPLVPLEFPNFNQNYTFVDNSSIRENLVSRSGIDTEVEDLLEKDEPPEQAKSDEVQPDNIEPEIEEEDIAQKNDTEWIEDGENTEDEKVQTTNSPGTTDEASSASSVIPNNDEETKTTISVELIQTNTETQVTQIVTQEILKAEPNDQYPDNVGVINGTLAAILVGVFLLLSILGYIALILWRKSLELKYGSREMLVDKDEFFDPDDLKHFSI